MDTSRAIALAQKLINKNGRTITIEKLSATPADSDKPWKGPATPTAASSVSVIAVFVGVEELSSFGVADDLLKRATEGALVPVPATGEALDDYDSLMDGGVRWKIEFIKALKPASGTILYAVGVSR